MDFFLLCEGLTFPHFFWSIEKVLKHNLPSTCIFCSHNHCWLLTGGLIPTLLDDLSTRVMSFLHPLPSSIPILTCEMMIYSLFSSLLDSFRLHLYSPSLLFALSCTSSSLLCFEDLTALLCLQSLFHPDLWRWVFALSHLLLPSLIPKTCHFSTTSVAS